MAGSEQRRTKRKTGEDVLSYAQVFTSFTQTWRAGVNKAGVEREREKAHRKKEPRRAPSRTKSAWIRVALPIGIFVNDRLGLVAQFFGAQKHTLAHDFARLELHDCACGDFHLVLRSFWIPPDAGLGETDLEDAKVAKFYIATGSQGFRDAVQSQLDDAENLLLCQAGFITDG